MVVPFFETRNTEDAGIGWGGRNLLVNMLPWRQLPIGLPTSLGLREKVGAGDRDL